MRRLPTIAAVLAAVAVAPATGAEVAYPEGYRDWHHVKSMVIQPGHGLFDAFGGIHHVYANRKAVQGYGSGKFADGSIIVFDLLDAPAAGGAITEGARKVVGVMAKDVKKHAATGGWGFEAFKGDSRTERAVGANAATACFACHAPRKENDYVFSSLRK